MGTYMVRALTSMFSRLDWNVSKWRYVWIIQLSLRKLTAGGHSRGPNNNTALALFTRPSILSVKPFTSSLHPQLFIHWCIFLFSFRQKYGVDYTGVLFFHSSFQLKGVWELPISVFYFSLQSLHVNSFRGFQSDLLPAVPTFSNVTQWPLGKKPTTFTPRVHLKPVITHPWEHKRWG